MIGPHGAAAGSALPQLKTTRSETPNNASGILPVEYKVLVEPQEVEEKTEGGIILPQDLRDKESVAQVKARLIDYGGSAFSDWLGKAPKPGDTIMMAKFAGVEATGADGKDYRLINDKEIVAILVAE